MPLNRQYDMMLHYGCRESTEFLRSSVCRSVCLRLSFCVTSSHLAGWSTYNTACWVVRASPVASTDNSIRPLSATGWCLRPRTERDSFLLAMRRGGALLVCRLRQHRHLPAICMLMFAASSNCHQLVPNIENIAAKWRTKCQKSPIQIE